MQPCLLPPSPRMLWYRGALLLLGCTLASFSRDPSLSLEAKWESWKTTYQKEYNALVSLRQAERPLLTCFGTHAGILATGL